MAVSTVQLNGVTLMTVADTTAQAEDVNNKYFYTADGTKTLGTGCGGGSAGTDVIFYDDLANNCRGGIAYSYSAAEFASLTEMPANPDHSDFTTHGFSIPMTSQGWNWSLTDAKAYVAKYGKLNIGQTYVPTDGKSHYICYVPEDAPVERWNTEIDISVSGGSVNWQIDDGIVSTANGYISVTFPSVGWHDVKLEAPSGVTYYPYYNTTSKSNELIGKLQKIIQVFCGDNITQIGINAFYNCYSLISFTIPDGATSINSYAFYNCYGLTSITIPDGVTVIGGVSFTKCYSLISIAIPDGVTSIDSSAFSYCYSLTSITIPDSATSIGSGAFSYCYNFTSLTIPDNVTSIGNYAFNYCYSLTDITIPDGITSIGTSVFASCYGLTSLTIPDSVTSMGNNAISYCYNLASLTIPDGVTSIGYSAFQNCYGLTSLTIPDGVTSIGNNTFYCCYSLTSLTIPDGVTSIGSNVFQNCFSLKNIIIKASTPPTLADVNAFNGLMSDYTIIVPAGSLSAYTSATNWSSVASHIVEAS